MRKFEFDQINEALKELKAQLERMIPGEELVIKIIGAQFEIAVFSCEEPWIGTRAEEQAYNQCLDPNT